MIASTTSASIVYQVLPRLAIVKKAIPVRALPSYDRVLLYLETYFTPLLRIGDFDECRLLPYLKLHHPRLD
jgi:hypothetical protein